MSKINIFMRGKYQNHSGTFLSITEDDEFERDGMHRYGWIEFDECEKLVELANQHYSPISEEEIKIDIMLEGSPIVIRDELLYALQDHSLAHKPFVARYLELTADKSPFASQISRTTLDQTSV